MALDNGPAQAFNLDLAKQVQEVLRARSLEEAVEWVGSLSAASPKEIEAIEAAVVKSIKHMTMYADLYDVTAGQIEKKKDTPEFIRHTLNTAMPGLDRDGIEGMLRKQAVVFDGIARLRGPQANPGLRFYAEEAAKLADEDYKGLAKPLRLFSRALSKINVPIPPSPKRGWAGDSNKRRF